MCSKGEIYNAKNSLNYLDSVFRILLEACEIENKQLILQSKHKRK